MEKISFTKMSGAGNDFIILDESVYPDLNFSKLQISKICDRHNGIGSDGVITISDSGTHDFIMNYYNADGSTGSLCGNGARCAILFAKNTNKLKSNKANFISNGIEYSGEFYSEDDIKFNLANPAKVKLNFKVKAGNQLITANYINTGSPHVVIYIDQILINPNNPNKFYYEIEDVPIVSLGREIRNLQEFLPGGVNVNFVQVERDRLKIRTYERGVEDETLACGTGSVASALITNLLKYFSSPVTLITWGNDKLLVNFEVVNNDFSNVSLTGPAKIIFTGEIQKSFLE
jgi:diaminopimelate epimerase